MGGHIFESPPHGEGSMGINSISTDKLQDYAVTEQKLQDDAVTERVLHSGSVWSEKLWPNAAWGYIDTIADAIKEFPPGTEIVHDLGYVPEIVSLTKLAGGTEAGNLFLTGRTMSSIIVFAESSSSGIFVHWWAMR